MRWLIVLCLAVALAGCNQEKSLRQIIPADIPPGTVFVPVEEVDFQVEAVLRIVRDPESPTDGIAAVRVTFRTTAAETKRRIHAAVWLPEGVLQYTPLGLIGTNLDPGAWEIDLTPEQPGFGVLTDFPFKDFTRHQEVIAAFSAPTRVKLIWEGGSRYFQFPGELWQVEIIDEPPPRF